MEKKISAALRALPIEGKIVFLTPEGPDSPNALAIHFRANYRNNPMGVTNHRFRGAGGVGLRGAIHDRC